MCVCQCTALNIAVPYYISCTESLPQNLTFAEPQAPLYPFPFAMHFPTLPSCTRQQHVPVQSMQVYLYACKSCWSVGCCPMRMKSPVNGAAHASCVPSWRLVVCVSGQSLNTPRHIFDMEQENNAFLLSSSCTAGGPQQRLWQNPVLRSNPLQHLQPRPKPTQTCMAPQAKCQHSCA